MDAARISHYRILEKLGAGGMGEVYLAEDIKLGRKVAIKILSEEYTTNRDRVSRFEQEASAASGLNHPNILTIHEVGNDEGRHFIATEYIDGITLRRRMAGTPLDTREVLDIASQVASALEEAHAAGIVHRDIKPDNIMIRRNGFVKVLDFGLAKLTENTIDRSSLDGEASTRVLVQTDAGVVMGTSNYMSPEQARAKPVDSRSDIWSLGVVIYEMIAGRTPFEGETSTDVIVAITQKDPSPLARFAPNVPPELEWIINKALRKDRDERYQTIKELSTDLRRLKQRLDFEAEMERSVAPESFSKSKISGATVEPTVPERAAQTAEKTVTHLSSAEYLVTGIKRHKLAALLTGLVVVVALIGAYLYSRRSNVLTEQDTVLLTDFVNTTGEPVFDGTLKNALTVQLGQTPFLNIFPDDRVRETLRFMGKSPDDRITRDVGREICERQGIKALLSGSIASLGTHYVITLEALNAHTGDPIAREQIEADSKEKVLSSLGTAASNLRKKLGESLNSIQKYDVPIEQATTSSLEALKAYSMGDEERSKGRARESLALYQRAVELDPNFAMGYARIAVFYGNQGQLESAKEYVQKAYDLRDRVSEHERLYITEKYCNYITGEIDKAIETLQTWARLYPNDFIPHNNLSLNYSFMGRYEEAQKEALEAIKLNPTNNSARENLVGSFMAQGKIDEAEQALQESRKINPDSISVQADGYILAFLRGDQATMDKLFTMARGKPHEPDAISSSAAVALYRGQFKKGEELFRQALDLFNSQSRTDNAAQTLITLALNQALVGKVPQAKENVKSGLALFRGRLTMCGAALALVACDDIAQGQSLIQQVAALYPKDTGVNMMGQLVKVEIARRRNNPEQAIQLLETVRGYDLGLLVGLANNYERGLSYLDQKKGSEAQREFQQIIDHRGVEPFSPVHVMARLGLARAAALTGDTATSRRAYQDFFALWSNGDQDLPVLIQAKKEYEQLK
jgi:serine/threonine protein kinase/tetratricopeptide (TPR) repeat protein